MSDLDISFVLKGADRGTDHVRAGDFVLFLQRLIACVSAIDEAVHGHVAHYLRIKNLRTSSAAATLEPVVNDSRWPARHVYRPLAESFSELICAAKSHAPAPPWATFEVLQKARELCETPKRVQNAELMTGGTRVLIDDDFRKAIDEFIGGEARSVGTISGRLDGINVHSSRLAYLYAGDGGPVACEFADELTGKIVAVLGKRVQITGVITRRLNSNRPVRLAILDVEELPENSELPLFASLLGSSPGATRGLSSEEYISNLREDDD